MVFAGPIFWDAKDAKRVMGTYRDFIANAPEELGLFVGLKSVPPTDPFPKEHWSKRACALIGAFNGPVADGQKLMASLLEKLPAPLFNWMGEMPWPAINGLFDPSFRRPAVVLEGRLRQALSMKRSTCTSPTRSKRRPILPRTSTPSTALSGRCWDATPWSARDASWSMVIAGISSIPTMRGAQDLGPCLLGIHPPFNLKALTSTMDADGATTHQAQLRRQLQAPQRDQGKIRSQQSTGSTRTSSQGVNTVAPATALNQRPVRTRCHRSSSQG
jgi:hypothetical protein